MRKSRLSRRLEDQTKKSVTLFVAGTVIIAGLLFKFGVPAIATLSYMIAGAGHKADTTAKKAQYVAPPVLNDTFSATKSAEVSISGTATAKRKIVLYVNDEKVDDTIADSDNTFSFHEVKLSGKENTIKAKAVEGKDESEDSNTLSITLQNTAPTLSADSPTDGQEFKKDDKTANISGKTDPGVKVTVNDLWAIVDENGNYSYSLMLHDGDNAIKIVATDDAGNTTEKNLTVKHSP